MKSQQAERDLEVKLLALSSWEKKKARVWLKREGGWVLDEKKPNLWCRHALSHRGFILWKEEVYPPIFPCQWLCFSEQQLFLKPFQVGAKSFPGTLSLLSAVPSCPQLCPASCALHPSVCGQDVWAAQGPGTKVCQGPISCWAGHWWDWPPTLSSLKHSSCTAVFLLQTDVSSCPKPDRHKSW